MHSKSLGLISQTSIVPRHQGEAELTAERKDVMDIARRDLETAAATVVLTGKLGSSGTGYVEAYVLPKDGDGLLTGKNFDMIVKKIAKLPSMSNTDMKAAVNTAMDDIAEDVLARPHRYAVWSQWV